MSVHRVHGKGLASTWKLLPWHCKSGPLPLPWALPLPPPLDFCATCRFRRFPTFAAHGCLHLRLDLLLELPLIHLWYFTNRKNVTVQYAV